ncbi:MAG TPA: putative glycoside hydrolase [Capillimicrobium sp.]
MLQPWETRTARRLERRRPELDVLAYQHASSMAQGGRHRGVTSSGVGFDEASGRHPRWFLRDREGQPVTERGYPWLWMADVGDPGYQRRWARNVSRLLRRGPWDGVFMDGVNATAKYQTDVASLARYPDDASLQAAMGSMLARVSPAIRARGHLAIANFGAWVEHPDVVQSWLAQVDGGLDEMFAKWSRVPGHGYRDPASWRVNVAEVQQTHQAGRIFLGVTQAARDDVQARRFGWATVLLGASGPAGYLAAPDEYEPAPPALPDGGRAPGTPIGPAVIPPDGVAYRVFSAGLVLVNPELEPRTVALPVPMSGSGVRRATTATMAPHSALVLRPHAPALALWPPAFQPPVSAR